MANALPHTGLVVKRIGHTQHIAPTSAAERLGSPAAGAKGLQLVWTTVEEVRSSLEGWFAGNSIPGPEKNVGKPFLQGYWHRWVGGWKAGRFGKKNVAPRKGGCC